MRYRRDLINRMTVKDIPLATKRGMYADGGGLYLRVAIGGKSKSWVFRFKKDGRNREMGLGSVDFVSLNSAREMAETCRKMRVMRIDPIEARKAA